jgi:choline-glycine betaine transporter
MNDKKFLFEILKDKDGNYALREMVTMIFVVVTLISWIAQQFCGIAVPEYMFYSFVSIIGAGCFGYSIEKKTKSFTNETKNEQQ